MNKIFHHIVLLLFTVFSFSFSQKTADFLILEKPHLYTILNQYQQSLTEAEQKEFAPGSPLQIVNQDEALGDQITRALRFFFNGRTFYLQKDEAGRFMGEQAKSDRDVLKNCRIVDDTVEINKEKAVPFINWNMPRGKAAYLGKGEFVVRVFRHNDRYYVKRSGRETQYGWVPVSSQNACRRVVVAAAAGPDRGYLHDRIIERFSSANETYKEYFGHFNGITGQQKSVPAWRCESRGDEIQCFLNNPYRNGDLLEESTQYIVQDIESMLLGKQYSVRYEKGMISIRPKTGSDTVR